MYSGMNWWCPTRDITMISKASNDPLANYLQRCRELIALHGHMVQSVFGQDGTAPYSYTAGLTTQFGFELVIFGLGPEMASSLLNQVTKKLHASPIEDEVGIDGIANVPLRLRTVRFDPDIHPISVSVRLGYSPTHLRYLIWPDESGVYPGDASYRSLIQQSFDDAQQTTRH